MKIKDESFFFSSSSSFAVQTSAPILMAKKETLPRNTLQSITLYVYSLSFLAIKLQSSKVWTKTRQATKTHSAFNGSSSFKYQ